MSCERSSEGEESNKEGIGVSVETPSSPQAEESTVPLIPVPGVARLVWMQDEVTQRRANLQSRLQKGHFDRNWLSS